MTCENCAAALAALTAERRLLKVVRDAALASLAAEKEAWKARLLGQCWCQPPDAVCAIHRAEAAEAERDRLREALQGLRWTKAACEVDEPDRFCDHAAEPCPRCAAARRALARDAARERT